jgi:enterochelin esterase family protein
VPEQRAVTFELGDRSGRLAGVRLQQEIGLPGPLDFVRTRGVWRLTVERPEVDRMEYLFELRDHNGAQMTVTDPANPLRAPGAFGDKSVLEFDGYQPPGWLAEVPVESTEASLEVPAADLDAAVELTLWTPVALEPDDAAPLVVAHDGPEYAALGGLTQYLGTGIAAGAFPPLRAALVGPGDRNAWYSANPAYARTLCEDVLAAVDEIVPSTVRVGIGASLGGLAMLHAHRSYPAAFDGLLLQSGSFFTPQLDPQEADFSGFAAVTEFVASVHTAEDEARPIPAVLTCGTVEENLANNELMAENLGRLGYPVHMVVVRDAHNYTAWRDALDPQLAGLLTQVVGARAS